MLLFLIILSITSVESSSIFYKGIPVYFKDSLDDLNILNSDKNYGVLPYKENLEELDEEDSNIQEDISSQSSDVYSEEALKQEFQQQNVLPVSTYKGVMGDHYYNNYLNYLASAYKPSESINTFNKQYALTNYQDFYYPKENLKVPTIDNSYKTTKIPSKIIENFKTVTTKVPKNIKIINYKPSESGDNRKFFSLFKYLKGGNLNNYKIYKVHKHPYPYNFGYKVNDYYGNSQWRNEVGDKSGAKRGSYGYVDAHGVSREVHYVADHKGFRAWIKTNEPGTANSNPASVLITHKSPPLITNYGSKSYYPSQTLKLPLLKVPYTG
ncbi:uncharacterized protein LOC111615535 [Centruroides sculpturatus]|uniref:uncharacterized protein LOC111615535 n=1 Tax=Centruroides sculpturatus TaxID=218467 RepID=UPI000C6D426A|nr:uncharacterized protein LOC111615535 [Centruroides sculpturatus]